MKRIKFYKLLCVMAFIGVFNNNFGMENENDVTPGGGATVSELQLAEAAMTKRSHKYEPNATLTETSIMNDSQVFNNIPALSKALTDLSAAQKANSNQTQNNKKEISRLNSFFHFTKKTLFSSVILGAFVFVVAASKHTRKIAPLFSGLGNKIGNFFSRNDSLELAVSLGVIGGLAYGVEKLDTKFALSGGKLFGVTDKNYGEKKRAWFFNENEDKTYTLKKRYSAALFSLLFGGASLLLRKKNLPFLIK